MMEQTDQIADNKSQSKLKAQKNLTIILTGWTDSAIVKERLSSLGRTVHFVKMDEENKSSIFNYKNMLPAIKVAQQKNADFVLGLDEATNKISMVVPKTQGGNFQLLNVHQVDTLLTHYWCTSTNEKVNIFKSIHLSDMLDEVALKTGNTCTSLLNVSPSFNDKKEESNFDVYFSENQEIFCNQLNFQQILETIIDMDYQAKEEQHTLFEKLLSLYIQYGYFHEKSFVVNYYSEEQQKHLLSTMETIRNNPKILEDRFDIKWIIDYRRGRAKNFLTQKILDLDYPQVNILKLVSTQNIFITFAPEKDKIYHYLGMKTRISSEEEYVKEHKTATERMVKLIEMINQL